MEPKTITDALDAIGQLKQELLSVLVLAARRDSAQSFPLADSLRARFEHLTAAEIRAISHGPGEDTDRERFQSYLPGYNVRLLLIIQASSQLRDVYGPFTAETMLKSAAARIVFAPKDYADAKEISEDLGSTAVRVRFQSRPSDANVDSFLDAIR